MQGNDHIEQKEEKQRLSESFLLRNYVRKSQTISDL